MLKKKRLCIIIPVFLISGLLYGIDIGNSNVPDATAYNSGPHIVQQAGTDTLHIVYHTQNASGTYVGIYDLLHYRSENDYTIVHRGPIPPPPGNGDVAYPSIAIEPWVWDCHGDTQHPIVAIAYLTNVDNSYLIPTGSPYVALYSYGATPHWVNIAIPMEEGVAGPPSIIGYAFHRWEVPIISVTFIVSLAHYNFCGSGPPDYYEQIELWAITIPITDSPDTVCQLIRVMDHIDGCVVPTLHNPSTAIFLEYDLSGGNPVPEYVWLHTVWEGTSGDVRYAVTGFPFRSYVEPSEIDDSRGPISLESNDDHVPFIDNYGDRINLTWRRGGITSGEIMLRYRDANYSDDPDPGDHWGTIYNMSQSSTHSDWPQCHSYTTVWQETVPPDEIRLRNYSPDGPADDWYTPSTATPPDRYPHIASAAFISDGSVLHVEHVYTLWTEGSTPPYDILFEDLTSAGWSLLTASSPTPANRIYIDPNIPPYYEIKCGSPQASYYCEKRDNHRTFGSHSVDVGKEKLIYNLPLLLPPYHYFVRAVISVPESVSSISETFNFGGEEAVVTATSEKPETLDYILPQNVYYRDWGTKLKITGSKGAYLENIKVYQFGLRKQPVWEQEHKGITSPERSIFSDNLTLSPALFSSLLHISYEVTRKERITLGVYDISGRLVRTLIHPSIANPGIHTLTWDGRGDRGEVLPEGVYFIRLKTEGNTLTKKVILMR